MSLLKELPKTETPGRLAAHIIGDVIPMNHSGFTLDPLTLQTPVFDDDSFRQIYLVSKQGHEQVFGNTPNCEEVYKWLKRNYHQLQTPNHYIGFWHYEGKYYLDITKAVVGLRDALVFGKLNRQHSIYHPYSGREIVIREDDISCGAA